MITNCFAWAHYRERQLWRDWERAGCPQDRVPAILRRASRSRPYWTRHWIVGWWMADTAQLDAVESFVPDNRREVPWYLAWTRIFFKGHVKHGDAPTQPHD